ncbi:MAG: copper-binding protein [Pseudomonadota bacterium]
MKDLKTALVFASLLTGAACAQAASHAGAPTGIAAPKKMLAPTSADMAEGEVRKVDVENKKVTIKHGVIKSLDMPAMTMVFAVKDAAVLEQVKAGDRIRFRAEAAGGSAVVTDIEVVK